MSWARIEDSFPSHPKILGLSDRAFRAQVEAICYCARYLTDGLIPKAFGRPKVAEELVAAGVWEPVENGYRVHDYLDYNPTRTEAADLAERRAKAGRSGGLAKALALAKQVPKQNSSKTVARIRTPIRTPENQDLEHRVSDEPPRAEVENLCSLLASLIEGNGAKRPTVTKRWRTEARLMLDRDERPPAEAEALIRWCQADAFWRANVLSMPKFREKYDQLKLQSQRGQNGKDDDYPYREFTFGDEGHPKAAT